MVSVISSKSSLMHHSVHLVSYGPISSKTVNKAGHALGHGYAVIEKLVAQCVLGIWVRPNDDMKCSNVCPPWLHCLVQIYSLPAPKKQDDYVHMLNSELPSPSRQANERHQSMSIHFFLYSLWLKHIWCTLPVWTQWFLFSSGLDISLSIRNDLTPLFLLPQLNFMALIEANK